MIKPILACENPYQVAESFRDAGWSIDFSQPPESGDPLVGISLFDNHFLLGITEGYVPNNAVPYIGSGIVFYVVIPKSEMEIHIEGIKIILLANFKLKAGETLPLRYKSVASSSCLHQNSY